MLTMSRVSEIAREFDGQAAPGPLGVVLNRLYDRTHRIENGSGIGGRGHSWRIVHIRSGVSTESVTTAKSLRRLLREWSVGSQKPTHAGSTFYARLVHEANGQEWRWCQVVKHSQSDRGAE